MIALLEDTGFVLSFGLFYYLSLLIHELGHCVAAIMVGWQPARLCIGQGKKRTIVRIGDLRFQVGSHLNGGLMQAFARNAERFKFAQFFHIVGGPLASAIMAACLGWLAVISSERNILPSPWMEAVWMFFLLECWLLLRNLWPRMCRYDSLLLPNDGLAMWRTLWLKRSDVPQQLAGHLLGRIEFLLNDGRVAEAREDLNNAMDALRSAFGERLEFVPLWMGLLFRTGQQSSVADECARLLESTAGKKEARVHLLDALACVPLFEGHMEMLQAALDYIDEALILDPEAITLKGTKGSLMIENGEVEGGMALLREVQSFSDSPNDQAITAYYLALGRHKLGDTNNAATALQNAKARYAVCPVAERVEAKITGTPIVPETREGIVT
ncbi:MAG: site-2 protease family protein [Chthoniobacteraceae bacterium]